MKIALVETLGASPPRAYPDPLAGRFKFIVGGVGCKGVPVCLVVALASRVVADNGWFALVRSCSVPRQSLRNMSFFRCMRVVLAVRCS